MSDILLFRFLKKQKILICILIVQVFYKTITSKIGVNMLNLLVITREKGSFRIKNSINRGKYNHPSTIKDQPFAIADHFNSITSECCTCP